MEQDIKPQDMPSPNHPLMQNDAEVRTLSDLIDVRENQAKGSPELDGEDDDDLDVSEALTFPHKKRRRGATPVETTDFDGDARTASPADDEDDSSYMTRADVEDSMNETDPDPNTGMGEEEFIGDAGAGRAPDMTGTVTGAIRGLGTHLPQDLGADGFQVIEPEELDPRAAANVGAAINPANDETEPGDALNPSLSGVAADDEDTLGSDGGQIPTTKPDVDNRDEALDATRRLK